MAELQTIKNDVSVIFRNNKLCHFSALLDYHRAPLVYPSVCHTGEPRLNSSRSRHTFHAMTQNTSRMARIGLVKIFIHQSMVDN